MTWPERFVALAVVVPDTTIRIRRGAMNKAATMLARNLPNELTTSKRDVPDESLMRALGKENWRLLQQRIELGERHKHSSLPAISTFVTDTLRPYVAILAEADRLENREELMRANVMSSAKTKLRLVMEGQAYMRSSSSRLILRRRAEVAYEKAFEILDALLQDDPAIANYLDRPVRFEGEICNVSPDPEGVPRLINSHSPHNQCKRPPRRSVCTLKIEVLRSRLEQVPFSDS